MQENSKEILSINERIMYILEHYGVSRYKFSQESGISETVLLNISKGKNKPSADFIEKLLNNYRAIDANWLISGNGSMLKKNHEIVEDSEPPPCNKQCLLCKEKERIIEKLEDCLKTKDISIESLQSERTMLKEYIEDLKRQLFEAHQEKQDEQKRKAS